MSIAETPDQQLPSDQYRNKPPISGAVGGGSVNFHKDSIYSIFESKASALQ